jgi:hypothetical protein
VYFKYVVDHANQLPLTVDLLFSSQTKSLESYTAGDISEYRFNSAQSLAVDMPSHGTVDLLFHLLDETGLLMFFGVA